MGHVYNFSMKTLDISIAGEINLDLILYGLPEVMPVERELLGTDFQVTLGSSSAILAHNLAVLGAHVGFVTLVGEDPLGKIALERLGESGADLSRVRVDKGGTDRRHAGSASRNPAAYPYLSGNHGDNASGAIWISTISNLRNTSICHPCFCCTLWSRTCRRSLRN